MGQSHVLQGISAAGDNVIFAGFHKTTLDVVTGRIIREFIPARKIFRLRCYIPGHSQAHSRKILRERDARDVARMAQLLPHDFDCQSAHCRYCGVPEYALVDGLVVSWCGARDQQTPK